MICKHCGKENEEGSKFCVWCGQIFEEQYNREMQQQTPYEQQTGAVGNQQQYQQNPYGQQPGGAGSQQQYQQNPYQQQPGGAGSQQQYQQNPYRQQPGGAGYQQQYQQNPYRQQPGGAGYQQQYQQNPYQQQPGMNGYQTGTRGPLPMNWYNFVVKVQYILILIANAYALVFLLLMGGIYGSKERQEFMHELSGSFIAVDILYMLLLVIASVLCVLVRQKLVKFQKDAWKWYIGYLIFNLSSSVIHDIGFSIAYGAIGFNVFVFSSRIIMSILVSGVCIVLNYIYFNKRKHLFVN